MFGAHVRPGSSEPSQAGSKDPEKLAFGRTTNTIFSKSALGFGKAHLEVVLRKSWEVEV